MEELREVPTAILSKWRAWRFWQVAYGFLYLFLGAISVVASAIVAANAKGKFLSDDQTLWVPLAAAVAALATTVLSPKQFNLGFETAARKLEAAIARYRTDPTLGLAVLGKAEAEGVEIINRLRRS